MAQGIGIRTGMERFRERHQQTAKQRQAGGTLPYVTDSLKRYQGPRQGNLSQL